MQGVNFRMTTDPKDNFIRVDFQKKVGMIGFSLQDAIVFRKLLDQHIESLQKMQHGVGNGRRDS